MPDKLFEIAGFLLGISVQGNRKSDNIMSALIPKIIEVVVIIIIVMYGMKMTVNYSQSEIVELKNWKTECIKEQADLKVADATMRSDITNQYREIINRLDAIQFGRNARRQQ